MKLTLLALLTAASISMAQPPTPAPTTDRRAKLDARQAATKAVEAARKAADAVDAAIRISAKEDAHIAAKDLRSAIQAAHEAARDATEKTEQAYRNVIAVNQELIAKARQAAQRASESTAAAVAKAEAWVQADLVSGKDAFAQKASAVNEALKRAATATKDSVKAGNKAAEEAWEDDMAKSKAPPVKQL